MAQPGPRCWRIAECMYMAVSAGPPAEGGARQVWLEHLGVGSANGTQTAGSGHANSVHGLLCMPAPPQAAGCIPSALPRASHLSHTWRVETTAGQCLQRGS